MIFSPFSLSSTPFSWLRFGAFMASLAVIAGVSLLAAEAPDPARDATQTTAGQPATTEAMTYMRNLLPPDAPWFAFGISLHQFPMVAQTVLLGGHPRVGLEDNIYLEKGKMAPSNAALVEKAARIIEVLGDHVATPKDARQILGLKTFP